jgi:uncharacterized protein (DUF433 family)
VGFFFPFLPFGFYFAASACPFGTLQNGVRCARRDLMSALDWAQCPAVESSPDKVSGAWVFRGTRMPVATVFENLEAGATIEDIMEWFDLSREQINTVLDFAARSLTAPDHR